MIKEAEMDLQFTDAFSGIDYRLIVDGERSSTWSTVALSGTIHQLRGEFQFICDNPVDAAVLTAELQNAKVIQLMATSEQGRRFEVSLKPVPKSATFMWAASIDDLVMLCTITLDLQIVR